MSEEQGHQDTPGDQPQHDPTGLELAQTVARSLGAQARRRRRAKSPPYVGPQVSGARADDRDPKPLSDAVERLVESKGWTTEINVHTLLARWALLVGATNAALASRGVCGHRLDRSSRLHRMGHPAALPGTPACCHAERGAGGRHDHPDQGSWSRCSFLEEGPRSVRDGQGPRDTYG